MSISVNTCIDDMMRKVKTDLSNEEHYLTNLIKERERHRLNLLSCDGPIHCSNKKIEKYNQVLKELKSLKDNLIQSTE